MCVGLKKYTWHTGRKPALMTVYPRECQHWLQEHFGCFLFKVKSWLTLCDCASLQSGINYQWSDGSDTVYTHWDAADDDDDFETGECVYMDVNGGWRRADCETLLPGALCHVPQSPSKPSRCYFSENPCTRHCIYSAFGFCSSQRNVWKYPFPAFSCCPSQAINR